MEVVDNLIWIRGLIGQPFFLSASLREDLRAQYMILEFDDKGLKDVVIFVALIMMSKQKW